MIVTEQGRGDMLQFIRYAPLLADLGAVVYVQAYPDLVPLLAAMPGVSEVVSTSDKLPDVDICTPVMSLPLAFGSQPANVPYLRVPVDRTIKLEPCSRLRVGVAWSGSLQSYGRSAMPAKTMAPVLTLPSYEFHCLQKEITETDLDWLDTNEAPIRLHTAYLKDFADTAALIDQMDVVMAIDTAVAHLAGALGKPVYILLPFNPDWRWMLGRSDSPWYPTARLYRQPDRGNWTPVIQAVIEDLRRI